LEASATWQHSKKKNINNLAHISAASHYFVFSVNHKQGKKIVQIPQAS
jgi:hypothetical protein